MELRYFFLDSLTYYNIYNTELNENELSYTKLLSFFMGAGVMINLQNKFNKYRVMIIRKTT